MGESEKEKQEKQDEQRFTLTFDEFFKIGMKAFFTEFGYEVQSEVELFKLPKKLDVLLLRQSQETPTEFKLLRYFKKHNLVSFKSPKDPIKSKDITDAVIYLNGFMNMTKEANYQNTTMSIFCNSKPRRFLKEHQKYITTKNSGYWVVDYGLFVIHIINLSETPFDSGEAFFLKEFATRTALQLAVLENNMFQNMGQYYKQKIVDIVKRLMYIRIRNFEKHSLEGIKMPTTWTADITDIVKPHYERGVKYGLEQGRQEGVEYGLEQGAYQKAIEAARKMLNRGYNINEICELTSLTREQVEKLSQEK